MQSDPSAGVKGTRILLLEDNATDAFLMEKALRDSGLAPEIVRAATREEFLEALDRGSVDIIIADNGLPGFSGASALALSRERAPETPFLVLTGNSDAKLRDASLSAGAAGFILKDELSQLAPAIRRATVRAGQSRNVAGDTAADSQAMKRLVTAVQDLSLARDLDTIMRIVRKAARELTGADGATFILREGEQCHYADEDAISPLWKGQKFPLKACVSGWAMLHCEPVTIEDIYQDPRVPLEAYRPTFVKSLVMVPIRTKAPIGAIGNYWSRQRKPKQSEIELLQALADSTCVAMENVQVYAQLEQRVKDRTLQLEAANHELETFSYSVSHDLRAPLRRISSFAGLIEMDATEPLGAKTKEYLAAIGNEVQQMAKLIEDLLKLAKFARVELRRQNVDLTRLAADVAQQLCEEFPERRLHLEIQPGLEAEADPNLVRVLLVNLLSNAWKYTSRRERAEASFGARTLADGSTAFFVRDNGAGFDMQYADKLFAPFQRLHFQEEFPGNGVGLATAQRIIHRHGGRIWAEAKPEKCATFFFTLPAKP